MLVASRFHLYRHVQVNGKKHPEHYISRSCGHSPSKSIWGMAHLRSSFRISRRANPPTRHSPTTTLGHSPLSSCSSATRYNTHAPLTQTTRHCLFSTSTLRAARLCFHGYRRASQEGTRNSFHRCFRSVASMLFSERLTISLPEEECCC